MKQVWSAKAKQQFDGQIFWYKFYKGEDFANSFIKSIKESVDRIMLMPIIGQLIGRTDKWTQRSILVHPRYRIIYKYNKTILEISRLKFTMMRE